MHSFTSLNIEHDDLLALPPPLLPSLPTGHRLLLVLDTSFPRLDVIGARLLVFSTQ